MKRIILHIGTEKTGTTSIQQFLDINASKLASQGLYIPEFLGKINHRKLPAMVCDTDFIDDFFKQRMLTEKTKRVEAKALWREEFLNKSRASGLPTWIVSSEHLQSRLRTPREIGELKKLIDESFASAAVILYIRNPIDTAISLWSTALKSGGTHDSLPLPSTDYWNHVCHHKRTIQAWQKIFGNTIKVRVFSESSLCGGDVIIDFCDVCGIIVEQDFLFPPRENQSLSLTGMNLLRSLNKKIPPFVENLPNPRRVALVKEIEERFSKPPKYRPTAAESLAYKEHFAESDEWVRINYFPEKTSLYS